MSYYQDDLPNGGRNERAVGSDEWRHDVVSMMAMIVMRTGGLNGRKAREVAEVIFDNLDDWGMCDAFALTEAVQRAVYPMRRVQPQ